MHRYKSHNEVSRPISVAPTLTTANQTVRSSSHQHLKPLSQSYSTTIPSRDTTCRTPLGSRTRSLSQLSHSSTSRTTSHVSSSTHRLSRRVIHTTPNNIPHDSGIQDAQSSQPTPSPPDAAAPLQPQSRQPWYTPSTNHKLIDNDRLIHTQIISGNDPRVEVFIDNVDDLRTHLSHLDKEDVLGVDLEFSSHTAYFPRLELIQIATNSTALFIFDAQRLQGELRPLIDILNQKELIFHGSSSDLRILYQLILQYDTPCIPKLLFDTQIATQYLNLYPNQIGLGQLMSHLLGVSMNKGLGGSDWSMRPLTARQLQYAFDDVRYLHTAREGLLHLLEEKGPIRLSKDIVTLRPGEPSLTTDEFSFDRVIACYRDMQDFKHKASVPPPRPDDAWLDVWLKDSLTIDQIELLKALTKWREITAYKNNRNPRVLVRNDVLVSICESIPESADELAMMYQNTSPYLARNASFIMDLIEAVQLKLTKSITPLELSLKQQQQQQQQQQHNQQSDNDTATTTQQGESTPLTQLEQEKLYQQMHLLRLNPSQQQLFNIMSTAASSIAHEVGINPEVFAPPRDLKAFILTYGTSYPPPSSITTGYRAYLLQRVLEAIIDGGDISMKWDKEQNSFIIQSIDPPSSVDM